MLGNCPGKEEQGEEERIGKLQPLGVQPVNNCLGWQEAIRGSAYLQKLHV